MEAVRTRVDEEQLRNKIMQVFYHISKLVLCIMTFQMAHQA